MTLTESAVPAAAPAAEAGAARPSNAPAAATGLAVPVTTSDAVVIGRLFMGVSLLAALGTAVIGVLVAVERLDDAQFSDVLGGFNSYFQMWTLHRLGFMLLVVVPLMLGLAMVVVPSQIGARNLAFPRAALASFWSWLIGGIITVVSVFSGGGWGAVDGVSANERDAIALTLLGTAMLIVSLLVGALSLATTIISSRAAGVSLADVPAFAWSMLVASTVWLLTLPLAVANIVLIYADLRGRDPIAFGQPGEIWLQLDWLVEQPAVYAMAIPAAGIAIDAISSKLGSKLARPEAVFVIVGLFGLLAVGGWSQDFFTAPSDYRDNLIYVLVGLAAVIPVVGTLGGIGELLARGQRSLANLTSAQVVGSVAAVLLLGIATLSGALRVIEPLDLLETSASSAVFLAVVAVSLAAGVAGLWCWSNQIAGREPREAVGRTAVVLLLVGGAVAAIVELIGGFDGRGLPTRIVFTTAEASPAVSSLQQVLNAGALVGAIAIAVAILVALGPAFSALRASLSGASATAAVSEASS